MYLTLIIYLLLLSSFLHSYWLVMIHVSSYHFIVSKKYFNAILVYDEKKERNHKKWKKYFEIQYCNTISSSQTVVFFHLFYYHILSYFFNVNITITTKISENL